MMGWMWVSSRRSGRFEPVDADDEELPLNGFACDAEISAFVILCPACGAPYEVRASDRHPRAFDRKKQRFRCPRCRFAAPVRVVVDCGVTPEPEAESPAAK